MPPEKSTQVNAGPPAVSPDGRRIAFSATVDGKRMLWVRDLDSLQSRILPGTENAVYPFWAPDSRQVGFQAVGKVMKIDVTGGPAVTVAVNALGFRGGAWNEDNTIVFAINCGVPPLG